MPIGTYQESGDELIAEVTTLRHHATPGYRPLVGIDEATLVLRGRAEADGVHFDGTLVELPGSVFRSVMTPIDEEIAPASGVVGEGGIANGLYSIDIRLQDGIDGGLSGVMLLNDGRILGGDAFFYYIGSYTSANGRWKGQMPIRSTPRQGRIGCGGHEVGIGFPAAARQGARLEATALAASAVFA